MNTGANKNSSQQILKSISIFGGLQVFLILINLVKGKAIALLIGVSGIGQFAILNNILNLMVQFAYLGLNFSAIRSISLSFDQNKRQEIVRTYNVFKYWTLFCAIFGGLITFLGSYYISKISFNSGNHTTTIMILSIGVIFTILFNGNNTFLQGIRELKYMAKSSFLSAIFGALISIPLFYFYTDSGIVWSIIITAILSFVFSSYFVQKSKYESLKLSFKDVFKEGSEMVKLGLVLMISSFIGVLVINLINIYIVKEGSVRDLGLFSAGNSITNQYIGLIFTAMVADYFPKLSAISNDKEKVNELVNNQGEILLIIVCPILLILMTFSPIVVQVLLSKEFLSITTFIAIMSMAMLFKAASFPIGYISFAKGDKKVFFIFEGVINSILILLGHTLGYHFGGINGIAWGILILYIVYFVSVNVLVHYKYNFILQKKFISILLFSSTLLFAGFLNFILINNQIKYIVGSIIILISLYYSYRNMNKKVPITLYLKSKFKFLNKRLN